MKKFENHKHYWWGENHQHHDGEESIIKLSFPRVFIRYRLNEGYFADFDDFFNNIAEVQWIDGEKPTEKVQQQIFEEAWNFLAIEERLLEEDLEDIDFDD